MPNYTKLFNTIVTSTIWTEDDKTRIVWITMLAIANEHGEVHASVPGLARVAGVSLEDCQTAIAKFLSPDAYSRTKDNEGRRIAEIDGGWELLNHAKYRRLASTADKQSSNAARQARHRERVKSNVAASPVTHSNAPVTPNIGKAEAEAEKKIPPTPQSPVTEPKPSAVADGGQEGKKSGKSARTDNLPTSPLAQEVAGLFGRRLTTPWSPREVSAYKACVARGVLTAETMALVARYYASERAKGDDGIHRRDLKTFLNNFDGEMDRARAWEGGRPKSAIPAVDAAEWSAFIAQHTNPGARQFPTYASAASASYLRAEFFEWRKTKTP